MSRLSFFLLLCLLLQCSVRGWLLGHVKTNRPTITQLRRNVAVSVIVLANIMSSPAVYAAVDMEVPTSQSSTVPMMTSDDVLRSDVTPRIAVLKDIQFTFKLYPEYVNQKDYDSFRKALRTPPSMDLRKTCLKLKPFLAEDKKKEFENKYAIMIDAVNDMDVTAFKRLQGEGVPLAGQSDEALLKLLTKASNALDELIQLAMR